MTWAQVANVALVGALILLGGALTLVLTGLDRRLDNYLLRRNERRFYGGDWR
jgi:hypothetical protein